jgi:hypothetical protein
MWYLFHKTPKSVIVYFSSNYTSIFKPPDQGIVRSFKHYYHKQIVLKTIPRIDHKFLHDATPILR